MTEIIYTGFQQKERRRASHAYKDKESSKIFLIITGCLSGVAVLAIIIVLPIYFPENTDADVTSTVSAVPSTTPDGTPSTTNFETNPISTNTTTSATEPPISQPPNERVDCLPDKSWEQAECLDRGCLWSPVDDGSLAPPCFFAGSSIYTLRESLYNDSGIISRLSLSEPEILAHYGVNFPDITISTTYVSATTLRVKISPSTERYEVPFDHPPPVTKPANSLYRVTHSNENDIFGVEVSRRLSSSVIFDTTFGELMFSEQFAQISTRVASEYVYGFGEHMHSGWKRDMDWKSWGMFAKKSRNQKKLNQNGVHPFFLCMEGNGDAYGVLFMNSNAMDVTLQPTPAITYRTTGGLLDFYIFLGPSPDEVANQYVNVIGKPEMPPFWSLGFHLSRNGYGSLDNLTAVAERNIATGLPYDVQHLDIEYMERGLAFTVNGKDFDGIQDYLRNLKENYNIRNIIVINPSISANESQEYQPYQDGERYQIFIKNNEYEISCGKSWSLLPGIDADPVSAAEDQRAHVAFPDFAHRNAATWWSTLHEDFYNTNIEFDGLWLDMNEPTSLVNGSVNGCDENDSMENPPYYPAIESEKIFDGTMCMTNKQYWKSDSAVYTYHYNMHSLYGSEQSRATMEACRKASGERCAILSTATSPGSGKYAGHSITDTESSWEYLKSSIIGVLEFNLFGIPYVGSEVCGCYGDVTFELCVRWTQLGAFHPLFRNHNSQKSLDQDPAYFGNEFVNNVREAMETRTKLLPYLYTLFYEANSHGSTVIRPLMFQFPNDNATYEIDDQFMWGSALLVSPVVEAGKITIDAYFPDSRWFDFYSGQEEPTRGSRNVLSAPIDHINLHIHGGNTIPMQLSADSIQNSQERNFSITVALDDNGESFGRLFWDDGVSIDNIITGEYTEIEFATNKQLIRTRVLHSHNSGENMTLSNINIIGIEEAVTRVKIDGTDVAYTYAESTKQLLVENLNLDMDVEFEIHWEHGNEWNRIDCMPSMTERPNRVSCLQRGCEWLPSSKNYVPNCFFALNGDGVLTSPSYSAAAVQQGVGYSKYKLTINEESRSVYGSPVEELTAEIEYQTNNRLHVKIKDVSGEDYEIPEEILNISSPVSSTAEESLYALALSENPFHLRVFRKSTGKLIFDTSIGPLVYEERYLQISTILPSENVFGFGEHNHKRYRHDLNWRRWGMFTRDWLPVGPFNLYGHQSFFMSIDDPDIGTAVGIYFHNSNAMDVVLQPRPSVTYRTTGGVLDFYIFLAESQEALTQEYQRLVGLPMMPPYWSLGFQLSRWGYGSLERVKEVVNDMRQAEIPFDVQYGDIDYMNGSKDFTYDLENYDGLPEFTNQLHEWGMRYVIILDPAIKIEDGYEPYERGIRDGLFVMNEDGVTPATSRVWPGLTHHADYTNPNTSAWWLDECRAFYNETAIKYDALWVDMNEPSSFLNALPLGIDLSGTNCSQEINKPPYMPRLLRFRTGLHSRTLCMENRQFLGRHYDLHSLYGHTMSQVTHDTLKNMFPAKRSFVITRSTFAGTGHYAGHWLGDNQSSWPPMEWAITGMIEFNIFGIPYVGADICGFMFDATAELCTRWMQVGAFYPFSRNHNANGKEPQHPTVFGPDSTASSKKVLEVRYSILPYFYTQHNTVHKIGGTVIRSLVHEFPSDRNTWNNHKQFLVGSGFLVTPVLENGARTVTGYFPAASRWFDFYTGQELHPTGFHISLDAPLDHINLHVRGGTIIPMQQPATTTVLSRQRPMSILAALNDMGEAFGSLYWDDGEARDVGERYYEVYFNCTQSTLRFEVAHYATDFVTDLFFEKATILGVTTERIDAVLTYEDSADAGSGDGQETDYTFDSSNSILTIFNVTLRLDTPHVIQWG